MIMGRLLKASKMWKRDEMPLSIDTEMDPDFCPWRRYWFLGGRLEAGTWLPFDDHLAPLVWKIRNGFTRKHDRSLNRMLHISL
jgi:hypothetical protein